MPLSEDHSEASFLREADIAQRIETQSLPDIETIEKRLVNASTPCGRVPPEILLNILGWVKELLGWPIMEYDRYGMRGKNFVPWYYSGWLIVTQVCWRWREVAFGSPMLWVDPDDYCAIPPQIARMIILASRHLPLRLDLQHRSFQYLTQQGGPLVLPRPLDRIQDLRAIEFPSNCISTFEPLFVDLVGLRALDIELDLDNGESPLRLPPGFCSNPLLKRLSLMDCLPSTWDAPIFSSQLTSLTLDLQEDHPPNNDPEMMPSILEFSHILSSTTSLETLSLFEVFPRVDSRIDYPTMVLPRSLHSLSLRALSSSRCQRDCLLFLAHLSIPRDIFLHVNMADVECEIDENIASELVPLIRTALKNVYRQLSMPKQLVLGENACMEDTEILTLGVDESQLGRRAEGLSCSGYKLYSDIIPVSSVVLLELTLRHILAEDPQAWRRSLVSTLIPGIHALSLSHPIGTTYLDPRTRALEPRPIKSASLESSEGWRQTFAEATDVRSVSVGIHDAYILLPLSEYTSKDGITSFVTLPRLETIRICVNDVSWDPNFGDPERVMKRRAYEAGLVALQTIVQNRLANGAPLRSIVVDDVLRGWKIWNTIRKSISIEFRTFERDTWHTQADPPFYSQYEL